VLNKLNGFYEILSINNKNFVLGGDQGTNLMNIAVIETLHLLSTLQPIFTGSASALVWHQYREE
jgi:hypothetical protein